MIGPVAPVRDLRRLLSYHARYDAENRLAWAQAPPGTLGATFFGYDGAGRRISKLVCPSTTVCLPTDSGASYTAFIYDAAGRLAGEYGPLADSGTRYMVADGLGSTRVVVDGSGTVQRCFDYLPFGEDITAGTGGRGSCFENGVYPGSGADKASQRFTGKERDADDGADYFGGEISLEFGDGAVVTSADAPAHRTNGIESTELEPLFIRPE